MRCATARRLVSQRLDGEEPGAVLDLHLAGCGDCRHFDATSTELRRTLRFAPVGTVPDLAAAVRVRLDPAVRTRPPPAPRRPRATSRRSAVAALAAGIVIGALLVGTGGDGPEPVAAAELPALVARAQATVEGLHAELHLVERGWNPAVGTRSFTGVLDYRAPESLALSWRDRTAYPSSAWRPDDVSLVTNGRSWVATGLPDCPSSAQPDCASPPRERAVRGRPPFAEDAPVPLELIVPVRSFASADTARVVGEGTVAGRRTIEVEVTAAQVAPLLAGLRPAGNLREVHPTDRVSLSLDAELLVPLRLAVRASDDPHRAAWALRRGYADRPGLVVLAMEMTDLEAVDPARSAFVPPAAAATDAGYRDGDPGLALTPVGPDGFGPYRTGRVVGATPSGVWSWSDGRAWVRLLATEGWHGPGLFGDLGPLVRPERSAIGTVYVGADGRRVGFHGDRIDLVVDGSVATDELVAVVERLGLLAAPLPSSWPEQRSASPAAIRAAMPGALVLDVAGFGPPSGRVDGRSVVQFAAGSGDRRLLLVQAPGRALTPTVEADPESVAVRGVVGRWSPSTGQLEWVEGGRVVTLRGSGSSRAELLSVAEALRPG